MAHGACVPARAGSAAEQQQGAPRRPAGPRSRPARAPRRRGGRGRPRSRRRATGPARRAPTPRRRLQGPVCLTCRLPSIARPHRLQRSAAHDAAQAASALPAHSAPCCKLFERTRAVRVAQRVVAPIALAALARLPPARQAAPGALRRALARPTRTACARASADASTQAASAEAPAARSLCTPRRSQAAQDAGATVDVTPVCSCAMLLGHMRAAQHAPGLARQLVARATAAPKDVPVQAGTPACAPAQRPAFAGAPMLRMGAMRAHRAARAAGASSADASSEDSSDV